MNNREYYLIVVLLFLKLTIMKYIIAIILIGLVSCTSSKDCPNMNWSNARRAYLR